MFTKIQEFHKMLLERAFNIDDTDNNILLRSISSKEIKLCLYDYVNEKIIGYITAAKDKRNNEYYVLDRSSADKGWGPFMYNLILQFLYPKGIKPSTTIRPAAINVYKHFLNDPNIKTNTVPESDPNFADMWLPDVKLLPREAPEELKIINTVFKKQPESWFLPFLKQSDEIIKQKNIPVNLIFSNALTYFDVKYDQSRELVTIESISTTTIPKNISIPVKDTTSKFFLVNEKGSNIEFMIQDKGKIFGYAELLKKSDYYQIANVAAEKGWGPLLYDSIMLYLDKPVRPNRSLSSDAWVVWNNYCDNRTDVTKKEINQHIWNTVDLDHTEVSKTSIIEPVNYVYTISDPTRKNNTINWVYNSEKPITLPDTMSYDKWKELRFIQGRKYFYTKYPVI